MRYSKCCNHELEHKATIPQTNNFTQLEQKCIINLWKPVIVDSLSRFSTVMAYYNIFEKL